MPEPEKEKKEQTESPATLQINAEQLKNILAEVITKAQQSNGWQDSLNAFQNTEKKENPYITKPNIDATKEKKLLGFKTYTFLDGLFYIDGIPFGSNTILVGIPNTGKSLLVMEIALKVANSGKKVLFCTSEEAWHTENNRYDLESRFIEKSKVLGLEWKKLSENLIILDVITHSELRDFTNFVENYKATIEKEKIELVLMDSLTLLEDSRGQIKFRLSEFCKYDQLHGVTAIFVSQRNGEDPDSIGSIAGSITLSHVADILMCMDGKRLSSWDGIIKLDTNSKQGEDILFFRILKNRISRFKANYFKYSISNDGLVKLDQKV